MSEVTALPGEMSMCVERDVLIDAPADVMWEMLLAELSDFADHANKPLGFKLEPWPGGRWYRDLGQNAGHFWGHVQVIKPSAVLEISGPMMMSFPAINHVSWRLTPENGSTRLRLKHRAMGEIKSDMAGGFGEGWRVSLGRVRDRAAARR